MDTTLLSTTAIVVNTHNKTHTAFVKSTGFKLVTVIVIYCMVIVSIVFVFARICKYSKHMSIPLIHTDLTKQLYAENNDTEDIEMKNIPPPPPTCGINPHSMTQNSRVDNSECESITNGEGSESDYST